MVVFKSLIKLFLIYLIVGNLLGYTVMMIEYMFRKTPPNVKSYKSFVLGAMVGSPDHFGRFKNTPDYNKLINSNSVDSVRYYWNKYKHSE